MYEYQQQWLHWGNGLPQFCLKDLNLKLFTRIDCFENYLFLETYKRRASLKSKIHLLYFTGRWKAVESTVTLLRDFFPQSYFHWLGRLQDNNLLIVSADDQTISIGANRLGFCLS